MPLTREEKESLLESYRESVVASPHVFLIKAQGITVPQITDLRDKVRDSGGQYVVVKNRIALRAIEGAALGGLKEHFVGPTAIAYGDDPVSIAKTLTEFSKQVPTFEFKGGLVDGQPITAQQVSEIADLPSREQLLAKLLYLMQSPVSGFVRALAAIPRDFVLVLDQIRQSKEQSKENASA